MNDIYEMAREATVAFIKALLERIQQLENVVKEQGEEIQKLKDQLS